ncbi:methyltransferase domain-containing protein [Roseovarius sp. LXJ103]|uniref:methyltransferase domain-containing protein n=1 Tax=Roseovarius carneus TaxID=2853164 RepID=UPI000D60DAFB|nr:methyltransferase domain-containing protein [Roseovarius carneus]MBZ8117890.1 methyltransferase domain-containing protein [Roseovarius carneus]PWE36352.1 SAM-dependent methyltransferase [Pelagicola sp. LXJ1103]
MTTPAPLTDRGALARHRDRAAAKPALFLHEAGVEEVQDRLAMVNKSFTAPVIVTGWPDPWAQAFPEAQIIADDETLALEPASYDLIIHALALHWANDPVGQLIQMRRALRPDGLMLTVLLGGTTLNELRSVLAQAETEVTGGLSPRVAPMGELRDMGGLLQRAGFALPVADSVALRASYADLPALMHDLRAMGETNAMTARPRHMTRRAIFTRAAKLYAAYFADSEARLIATYDMIVLTGWAPDETQQKPLRPGSASARLAEALGTRETPLED